jgi:hypothetical protein
MPLLLAACTPTFNWRELSFEQASASGLLPCKPDRASRPMQLADKNVVMHMAGCETGGAMFTLALVELQDAQHSGAVQAALEQGKKAQHHKLLSHGKFVLQAAIYGQAAQGKDGPGAYSTEAVDTFLSSVKLSGAQ